MRAAPLVLLALLAGCSADYPISPIATASPVTGPVNGIFEGRETLVDAKDDTCPLGGVGTLELGDGRVLYPYSTHVNFAAPVGGDGKFHDQTGESTIDGTLLDGALAFTVKTPACTSSFAFVRIAGF